MTSLCVTLVHFSLSFDISDKHIYLSLHRCKSFISVFLPFTFNINTFYYDPNLKDKDFDFNKISLFLFLYVLMNIFINSKIIHSRLFNLKMFHPYDWVEKYNFKIIISLFRLLFKVRELTINTQHVTPFLNELKLISFLLFGYVMNLVVWFHDTFDRYIVVCFTTSLTLNVNFITTVFF